MIEGKISEAYFKGEFVDKSYEKAIYWAEQSILHSGKYDYVFEILIAIYLDSNFEGNSMEKAMYWYDNFSVVKNERLSLPYKSIGHCLFDYVFCSVCDYESCKNIRKKINEELRKRGTITEKEEKIEKTSGKKLGPLPPEKWFDDDE